MSTNRNILIDWGTTNFRAYLLSADGRLLDSLSRPAGILAVEGGDFASALDRLLAPWRGEMDVDCPVLMSGMIGSRQGWVEAPYVDCPATLDDLAAGLIPVPARPGVRIVPGIALHEAPPDHDAVRGGRHDVMRGEEVQIFGALDETGAGEQVFCLPGTHSKWARVEGGRLTGFRTSMTGEAFAALTGHTILGILMAGDRDDGTAFRRGLERAGQAGGLLHHLFSVRADGLFGDVPPDGLKAYLSGILIGHEIRAMAEEFPTPTVRLIGDGRLLDLYGQVLSHLGIEHDAVTAEAATVSGLKRLLTARRNNIPSGAR